MAGAADQRNKGPVTAGREIGVAVAEGDQSPAVRAGERVSLPAVQGADAEARPSRVASADKSRPAKSISAKSISAKGVSSTRTKASVTRPRKKPEIELRLPERDAAALASEATATVGGEAASSVERSHSTSPRSNPQTAPRTSTTSQATSQTAARGRAGAPARKRGSGALGLAGRARLPEWQALLALPDALFSALPALRQAILNAPLDEALALVADGLASALAPAAARIWIADVAPWSSSASRVGGSGIAPGLRPRARSFANERGQLASRAPSTTVTAGAGKMEHEGASGDPLLEEVASARRPTLLFDAVGHPLARSWTERANSSGEGLPALGTLAAYPLRARGPVPRRARGGRARRG